MICGICLEKLVFDFVPEVVVLESDQINNLIRKGEVDFFYIRIYGFNAVVIDINCVVGILRNYTDGQIGRQENTGRE